MSTTLIEAAQDVVTICKMYRTSLPLDVLSEVKNLEQAIAQEQPYKFDLLVITKAYEQGVGKGMDNRSTINPYAKQTPAYSAWELGHEEGQSKLKQKPVRSCETCIWVGRAPDQAPCNNCTTNELFVDNWEPKP